MSTEPHVSELLPDYALGCLNDEDSASVANHLVGCPNCQAEFEQYLQVTDQLVLALPEFEPADTLADRLRGRIRPVQGSPDQIQLSWWQKIARLLPRPAPIWAVTSIILILVLGFTTLILWQRVNQLEQNVQSRGRYTINLVGTENAQSASGYIIVDEVDQENLLIVTGLPPLDDTQQYQLWLIDNGQRASGAVFSVGAEGFSQTPVSAPLPIFDYSGFGITVEPYGGSDGPTGNKVMGSSF